MKYFSCSNLKTGYNKKSVIHDISISFNKSEITSIIGLMVRANLHSLNPWADCLSLYQVKSILTIEI